jgi:hypothetical protein
MWVGKREITEPLAGKSTLNRMELGPGGSASEPRYHKITYSEAALDQLLVDLFWSQRSVHRPRSSWMWMRPICLYRSSRKDVSFTVTAITAICRCISSVAITYCARGYGARTFTLVRGAWKKCNASWHKSGPDGPRSASFCGRTQGSAGRNS